jgi:HK97 family phage prohead protease
MKKELIYKTLIASIKASNDDDYTLEAVFSTADEDRHGESIEQGGWKLKEYMSNPVILFAHDQWQPAIGKAIDLKVEGGKLVGKIKFAVEEYPFAETIYKLYKGGFMRAFSVGFRNEKYEVNEDTGEVTLLENMLYEISCVNVPANAYALAKQKGVDMEKYDKALAKHSGKRLADGDIEKIAKSVAEQITSDKSSDFSKEVAEQISKQVSGIISADNSGKSRNKKVETPHRAGGNTAKRKSGVRQHNTNRSINKAVRQLLAKKRR